MHAACVWSDVTRRPCSLRCPRCAASPCCSEPAQAGARVHVPSRNVGRANPAVIVSLLGLCSQRQCHQEELQAGPAKGRRLQGQVPPAGHAKGRPVDPVRPCRCLQGCSADCEGCPHVGHRQAGAEGHVGARAVHGAFHGAAWPLMAAALCVGSAWTQQTMRHGPDAAGPLPLARQPIA